MKPRIFSGARRLILFSSIVFTWVSSSALAATYTWRGGTSLWTDATAAGWSGGPPVSGDTATINGGLVNFTNHDAFGNAGTTTSASIILNGGTLVSNGFFATIWNLNFNGGAAAAFPAFQLAGTVSVGGTQMSTIDAKTAVNANNPIHIGGNGNPTLAFNVADVTGNANPDLTINATRQNRPSRSDVCRWGSCPRRSVRVSPPTPLRAEAHGYPHWIAPRLAQQAGGIFSNAQRSGYFRKMVSLPTPLPVLTVPGAEGAKAIS